MEKKNAVTCLYFFKTKYFKVMQHSLWLDLNLVDSYKQREAQNVWTQIIYYFMTKTLKI